MYQRFWKCQLDGQNHCHGHLLFSILGPHCVCQSPTLLWSPVPRAASTTLQPHWPSDMPNLVMTQELAVPTFWNFSCRKFMTDSFLLFSSNVTSERPFLFTFSPTCPSSLSPSLPSIYLSIRLSIHPSIHPSVHPTLHSFFFNQCLLSPYHCAWCRGHYSEQNRWGPCSHWNIFFVSLLIVSFYHLHP